jgi:hypothetical protein
MNEKVFRALRHLNDWIQLYKEDKDQIVRKVGTSSKTFEPGYYMSFRREAAQMPVNTRPRRPRAPGNVLDSMLRRPREHNAVDADICTATAGGSCNIRVKPESFLSKVRSVVDEE